MTNESAARASAPPSDDEYHAFVLALSESARGRAFLAEHARRSRAADNEMLLASVQRLEALVLDQGEAPAETPSGELRDVMQAIESLAARLDIDALSAQVGQLAALIEGMQERLENLAVPPAPATELPAMESFVAAPEPQTALPVEETFPPADFATAEADVTAVADEVATDFAVIETPVEAETEVAPEEAAPESDFAAVFVEMSAEADSAAAEPETAEARADVPATAALDDLDNLDDLAVTDVTAAPSADDEAPAAGLAIGALVESLATEAEDTAEVPQEPADVTILKAGTIPPPAPFAGEDFTSSSGSSAPREAATLPPVGPLADIMALSEDERVALFT